VFQDAILRRHCVAIDYDTAGRGVIVARTVEPLGLTHYANHWHLIAFCRLRQDFRDFRLDRIRMARASNEQFAGHSDFDLESFFEAQIDQGELIAVTLVVETWALERLGRELPGTPTSKVELPDGRSRISMLACHLEWISRWLLGFGTAIQVESPPELRRMLHQAAHGVTRLYPECNGANPD
jgi:predicted DNA-binding transcriptional regulator YafY